MEGYTMALLETRGDYDFAYNLVCALRELTEAVREQTKVQQELASMLAHKEERKEVNA